MLGEGFGGVGCFESHGGGLWGSGQPDFGGYKRLGECWGKLGFWGGPEWEDGVVVRGVRGSTSRFWGTLGGGCLSSPPNRVNPSLPAVVELCLTHGLGPVALANELLAFVTSKDLGTQLSADGLHAFEHEVIFGGGPRVHPKTPRKKGEGDTHTHPTPPLPPAGPRQAGQPRPPEKGQPLRWLPRRPLPPGAVSCHFWGGS